MRPMWRAHRPCRNPASVRPAGAPAAARAGTEARSRQDADRAEAVGRAGHLAIEVVRQPSSRNKEDAEGEMISHRKPMTMNRGINWYRQHKIDPEKTVKARKPWEDEGISETEWYRRRAKERVRAKAK